MPIYEKHFTLEEARSELPGLRRAFARIHELIQVLEKAQMELAQVRRLVNSNGHGSNHPDFGKEIAEMQQLVEEISMKGIEIKDIATGLVDFPHWREREEVFLCWRYGEEDIDYWHTLDGGFAGRRPLS